MNLSDSRYARFELVREMVATVGVVRAFDPRRTAKVSELVRVAGKLLLTGEGSSRIFPAKNAVRKALTRGMDLSVFTSGGWQAAQYDLRRTAVFCVSNSGRTREMVLLAKRLHEMGHHRCFALTADAGTPLTAACEESFVLKCGREQAIAATKSVVEQALFYESLLWNIMGVDRADDCADLSSKIEQVLAMQIDPTIIATARHAPTICFSGYDDGVAEELRLKTNEIVRRKSDFFEGTYAVHGIEEVMTADDVVFVVDPIEEEIEKLQEVLVRGLGMKVVAIAARDTPFDTIRVPDAGDLTPYLYLCAGWNVLVEIGLSLGIDLDTCQRARKIGNEYAE